MAVSPWPVYDEKKLVSQKQEIVIQVNGKLRDRIVIPTSIGEGEVKSIALQTLADRGVKIEPKRVIYIPNKLVNFVVPGEKN